MVDYKQVLKSVIDAVGVIEDPELRKVAFTELLRQELGGRAPQADTTRTFVPRKRGGETAYCITSEKERG